MWCMILTMTTVGYGEIYPVTIFGRIFTIIACIWGMFNMSMIIVTLTGIVKHSPEQLQSFQEICNQDPDAVRKIKNEATVVIQLAWKHFLARGIPGNPKFPTANSKIILKTRLEFTSIARRYKYKRLNVVNANPQLSSIIIDLKHRVNNFLESGMKNLNIYRTEITKQVGQMRANQYQMDAKMLKMYDVTMKLNSFLVACNRGEVIEGKNFNKNKNLYTHRRAKMQNSSVKEFLALFKDARVPVDSFYEGYRPAEKEKAQNGSNQGDPVQDEIDILKQENQERKGDKEVEDEINAAEEEFTLSKERKSVVGEEEEESGEEEDAEEEGGEEGGVEGDEEGEEEEKKASSKLDKKKTLKKK